ncbi:efflux RND transporter permease subunit [Myxococcota bacterium]|nr:efflux RND transporter permease subunit [Myxococcota bacterium]
MSLPPPPERPQEGFYGFLVDRPLAVLMVFVAVAVFGWVSYGQLPLNLMPDLSYPTLTVRTEYPGAAPEEVESQVSRRVEEALSTADGLLSIESRSRAERSDVILEFNWGTDMSAAAQSVREQLQTSTFGDDVGRPLILRYDPTLDPILRIALSVKPDAAEEVSLFALRELAEDEVKRAIETLDGVAAVRVRGGLERQVLIEAREEWLVARGVTLAQLQATLTAENVNIAGGSIREGETEYLLRTLNEIDDLDELKRLRVRRSDGQTVPLSELAIVRETYKDRQVISHLDGQEAVELEVFKEADANIVSVARRVKAWLGEEGGGEVMPGMEGMDIPGLTTETFADRLPEGVTFAVLDDQAAFIEDAITNLGDTAVQGGLLAILILFLFLRDFSATRIIAIAIPISIVSAFAPMYLGGVSLNLMSLGGLALGVGMLVDNSVVVLEAITVYREAGWSRREAAIAGSAEVAAAVVASTLTTVAVFLPIVFVEGVAGQIFGDLALTVVYSLLASLAVALFLVPVLAARDFGLDGEAESFQSLVRAPLTGAKTLRDNLSWMWEKKTWLLLAPIVLGRDLAWIVVELGARLFLAVSAIGLWIGARAWGLVVPRLAALSLRLAALFGQAWDRVADAYPALLSRLILRPTAALSVGLFAFLVAILAWGQLGRELIPEVHQGRFTLEMSLPVGTPLDRTAEVIAQVEALVLAHPEVERVYSAIGSDGRSDARPDEGEHTARILVQLSPGGDLAEREARTLEDLRTQLKQATSAGVKASSPALFSFSTPVEVLVFGPELDELRRTSAEVVGRLEGVEGLRDVRSSLVAGFPEVRLRYDRALMDRFGLSTSSVAAALRDKIQGVEATRMSRGEKRVDMVVRLVEADRASLADLERVNVNPNLDPPIPLSAVATLESAEGPSEVRRVDQRRAAVITANLEGFDLNAAREGIAQALVGLDLEPGYSYTLAGQAEEMDRSLDAMIFALLLAVFLVYVIMASTFESLVHPFIILFTVPMAAVGVLPVLLLTGTPLSVVAFIGVIVLAGVVVNNAIVLVDRINRGREQGESLEEAVVASGRARLRPIFITTATTVIGLLPLSLGFGAGAELQQPLAVTVIAGLSASTLLTLLVIPAIYLLIERLRLPAPAPASDTTEDGP